MNEAQSNPENTINFTYKFKFDDSKETDIKIELKKETLNLKKDLKFLISREMQSQILLV